MMITWPKKIAGSVLAIGIWSIVTGSVGAAWVVAKRDSSHEERVNVAMEEFKIVKNSVEEFRAEIAKVKEKVDELKISDAKQTVVAEGVAKTLTRIEDKIDSWKRIEDKLDRYFSKGDDK